jgi:predicted ATPase
MSTPDGPSAAVPRQPEAWIRRVRIRNFRSIAYCDVELKPLTVLVGRNGSGKSNFIDAIMFLKDALREGFSAAIGRRGGFRSLLFLGAEPADTFSLDLELAFADGRSATYRLELGDPVDLGRYRKSEELATSGFADISPGFRVEIGPLPDDSIRRTIRTSKGGLEEVASRMDELETNRPALRDFSTDASVSLISDIFQGSYNYAPWPASMRVEKHGTDDNVLAGDGANVASVLARLESEGSETVAGQINAYLKYIVPMIEGARAEVTPAVTLLALEQVIAGRKQTLYAHQMSDGTLRALACLVAVAQQAKWGPPVRLVAIEEPETSIHPAAVRGLFGAFDVASVEKQVLITTHSPDLIDRIDLEEHQLLAVELDENGTRISPVDEASREAIKERLATPGELLRMEYIQTNWRDLERQAREQTSPEGAEVSR